MIKKEQALILAALGFKPEEDEKIFNDNVEAAMLDYHAFAANKWLNPSPFEIDLFTNFEDFFEFIIDVKKKQNEEEKSLSTAAPVTAVRGEGNAPPVEIAATNAAGEGSQPKKTGTNKPSTRKTQ